MLLKVSGSRFRVNPQAESDLRASGLVFGGGRGLGGGRQEVSRLGKRDLEAKSDGGGVEVLPTLRGMRVQGSGFRF